jgi:hypothetical protein
MSTISLGTGQTVVALTQGDILSLPDTSTQGNRQVVIQASGTVTLRPVSGKVNGSEGDTSLSAGNYTLATTGGVGATWTTSSSGGGVTSIVAGTNITIDPVDGIGDVTINSSGGSSNDLIHTRITVPNANLKQLFATPYLLISSAANVLKLPVYTIIYQTGTTPFTKASPGALVINVDTGLQVIRMNDAVLTSAAPSFSAASCSWWGDFVGVLDGTNPASYVGKGIYLVSTNAEFATGDGNLIVDLWYSQLDYS